jgi:acyl-CoA reductase-like NAD-dependent aldehyde dehydrogenase/nicotinamidase-related amidase
VTGRTALLVIDCQEDFLARPGLDPVRETLIVRIAKALEQARSSGIVVYHVRTSSGPDGSSSMPHRASCPEVVHGTQGAAAPSQLTERDGEMVFIKRFFSAFDAVGLADALKRDEIKRVMIVGVHTHACIQATALDAYARGYTVEIDPELVGSDRPHLANRILDWLDGRAVTLARQPEPTIVHRNPANQAEILFEVCETHPAQISVTIDRLTNARQDLERLAIEDRCELLSQWHRNMSEDRETFIEAIIRDVGKPRGDAEGEVDYGLALLADVAATASDDEQLTSHRVRYRSVGTVGLITPWNNPFAIPVGKLAPCLAFGNTALWKPSPAGNAIAAMIHEALAACGLASFVECIDGGGTTGESVVTASGISALSFTGSVPVGQAIIAEAGRRALPVQAEMGGSNAAIIDSSADLDAAALDLALAIFSFAGQRCTAIRRIIVHSEVFDSFEQRLADEVGKLKIGEPSARATDVGPVIDTVARQRLCDQIDQAISEGARAVSGGTKGESVINNGCWLAPTILADLPPGNPLLVEEVFGPIALLIRCANFVEALAYHNDSHYGLVGALYTTDKAHIEQFQREAQAGILSVNRARPPFAASGPFIGWKNSGFGTAEHGRWNRDFYTRPQAIY